MLRGRKARADVFIYISDIGINFKADKYSLESAKKCFLLVHLLFDSKLIIETLGTLFNMSHFLLAG
jgi:hypothetical protein